MNTHEAVLKVYSTKLSNTHDTFNIQQGYTLICDLNWHNIFLTGVKEENKNLKMGLLFRKHELCRNSMLFIISYIARAPSSGGRPGLKP